jgi:hypothetical protein
VEHGSAETAPIHVAQFDLDIGSVALIHRVIEGAMEDWAPGDNPLDRSRLADLKLAFFAALLDYNFIATE